LAAAPYWAAAGQNPLVLVRLKAFYLDPAGRFLYLAGTRTFVLAQLYAATALDDIPARPHPARSVEKIDQGS
jgi:hypothetical protein